MQIGQSSKRLHRRCPDRRFSPGVPQHERVYGRQIFEEMAVDAAVLDEVMRFENAGMAQTRQQTKFREERTPSLVARGDLERGPPAGPCVAHAKETALGSPRERSCLHEPMAKRHRFRGHG